MQGGSYNQDGALLLFIMVFYSAVYPRVCVIQSPTAPTRRMSLISKAESGTLTSHTKTERSTLEQSVDCGMPKNMPATTQNLTNRNDNSRCDRHASLRKRLIIKVDWSRVDLLWFIAHWVSDALCLSGICVVFLCHILCMHVCHFHPRDYQVAVFLCKAKRGGELEAKKKAMKWPQNVAGRRCSQGKRSHMVQRLCC